MNTSYIFMVDEKEIIEEIYRTILNEKLLILDKHKEYPNYVNNISSINYYALYFSDLDNIKLEFVYAEK